MAFLDELRYLINLSHALAWDGAVRSTSRYNTPDEPGLVAAFLDSIIQDELENQLRKALLATANLQIDSIFTHKTPLVEPSGKSPVEIGDLLLIRQHFVTSTDEVHGMALLLQAKRNIHPSSGDISSGNPRIQFELYRDWPSFYGHSRLAHSPDPTKSTPPPWDFKLSNPHGRFGQYLAIYGNQAHDFSRPANLGAATAAFAASLYPPNGPTGQAKTAWSSGQVVKTASPTDVTCLNDFAGTLEDFINGNAGEPFIPGEISGSDHWSCFVNTMLAEAAKLDYTFLSRRTNVTTATRRGSKVCTFMAIQPLMKLAVMREVHRYAPDYDNYGLLDFEHEPHFYFRAAESSEFIANMRMMQANLREEIRADGPPPTRPEEPARHRQDGGYHVPILSIATSGPEPLWALRKRRRD